MKTISKQYQDLLEGKMSRDNFVRNCRQQFPQYVSPVTSIDDAIKILKSKRIIGESAPEAKDYKDPYVKGYIDNQDGYALEDCPYEDPTDAGLWKDGWLDYESEKQAEHDEETYRRETGDAEFEMPRMESLNEATEKSVGNWEKSTGKDEYGRFKDIDNVNYTTFLRAIAFEVAQQQDFNDGMMPAVLEKVAKKMRKDPNAYRELVIANYADVAKQDESMKMIPVNGKNHTDEDNAMEKIKGQETPKATSSSNKENRKGKPKGVKEMGITPKKAKGITSVMDMPGKEKVIDQLKESIIKYLKEDTHFKYSRGARAVTPDGEGTVKEVMGGTVTVELKNGKTQDYQINTLDHHEKKTKEEGIMPGVDLGGSFEKMKSSMGQEQEFEDMMKTYDWYAEMSDDSSKWDAQQEMESKLKALAKSIGAEKAAETWNKYAPKDRQIQPSYFMENKKEKYSKLKEYLKKALKKEATKFKAGGETIFTNDAEAAAKEQELKKAGVKFTKTKA